MSNMYLDAASLLSTHIFAIMVISTQLIGALALSEQRPLGIDFPLLDK
tara:strand:- start:2 stop:145 length:144 start_codon:yes stop_codon:yes gene_type:complete